MQDWVGVFFVSGEAVSHPQMHLKSLQGRFAIVLSVLFSEAFLCPYTPCSSPALGDLLFPFIVENYNFCASSRFEDIIFCALPVLYIIICA